MHLPNLLSLFQHWKFSWAFCLGFFSFSIAFAQTAPPASLISGTVLDAKTKHPIEFVSVSVARLPDTVFVSGVLSTATGTFRITGIPSGNYVLKVSYVGFKTVWKPLTVAAPKPVDAGTTELTEGITLNELKLEGEVIAVKVKTDTTEFNTAAFKAAPDASVEDGLKKVPGLEVDATGAIKANGEDVKKVYVDGKEFFGGDPKMATKNLPYDAISKVQVIDEKTDQAKASGIDDGKRSKAINLVLKDDKKSGWFGSGSLAGGTEDRYLGSMGINRFTKDKQLNALLMTNNMNQVGFSSDEAMSFGGGSVSTISISSMGSSSSMSINGVAVGGSNQGLTKTTSGGLNYSDSWGKKDKLKVTSSYFLGANSTRLENQTNTQSLQSNNTFYDASSSNSFSSSQSHRVNLRMTAAIDSLTSFSFSPYVSLSLRDNESRGNSAKTNAAGLPLNSAAGKSDGRTVSPSVNGNLSLSRQLHQRKGSMSLSVYGNYSSSNSDNTTNSENVFADASTPSVKIRRQDNLDNLNYNLSISPTYRRVISKDKKTSLSTSPTFNINNSNNDRQTLNYNPATGAYELPDAALTNDTRTKNMSASINTSLSRSITKWNWYLNLALTTTSLSGHIRNDSYYDATSKNYLTLLPDANISFRPSNSKSVTLSVSAYTSTPAISDLLLKQNNTSPLYIREGNPDLKMAKTYSSSLRYSSSNPKTNTYTNFSISYSKTLDASGNSTFLDQKTGITTSKRVNVDGNYSLTGNGSFSLPLPVKGLRVSPTVRASNSHRVNLLDGKVNTSDQMTAGPGATISYTYKDAVNLTVNNNTSFVHINNSIQKVLRNNYVNMTNTGILNLEPVKKWRIISEVSHTAYAGQQVVLVNAGIQRYLLDKNKLSMELRGYDLLNRNSDVFRSTQESTITDTRTNSIRQYFFLKLTYKITKVGSSPSKVTIPTMIGDSIRF